MKQTSLVVAISAALMATASAPTFADDSFTFNGYAMVASDFQAETGKAKNLAFHIDPTGPNQDPRGKMGDMANSYWHDMFTAIAMNKRWNDVAEEGQWADLTFELVGYGDKSVEAQQLFARYGGLDFLPEDATVWAGRRYTGERIRIFAYNIRELNADAGFGYNSDNFDFTIGYNQDDMSGWSGEDQLFKTAEPSRALGDFAYRIGQFELGATYVKELEDKTTELGVPQPHNGTKRDAISAFAKYKFGSYAGLDGNSTFIVQAGKGVIAPYLNTNRITVLSEEDDKSMRASYYGMINQFDGFTIEPALVYEYTDRAEDRKVTELRDLNPMLPGKTFEYGSETEQKVFAGVNVYQPVTNHISMQYEAIYAHMTNRNGVDGADGGMYKIAAGPSIQLKTLPWVAPITNFSVAYAGGDQVITDLDVDNEWRVGFRMEAFF
ncbi:carbohydrate porin [Photobacterium rosenbergii]|uniref:Carbohydrate porin n=1 Tax=Photobacterium rosenbergii TaxID=294936 RepID=A0ABU3ZND6_9GAMM|nr:carbohydrate porin [Photobacterium rosenbergii]MDV5171616.1 carbohydrate porin [Photobacterium rosenbergii]